MKLLLVGSSGLVGSHVLNIALSDSRISTVIAPSRRALSAHPKLLTPIINFDSLPNDEPWWHVDAVICTLGTTIRIAGSKAEFHRVDHDYPLSVARLAKHAGTPTFVLNSAIGANAASYFFYNRVKGELEQDLTKLDFQSLTFVRPGLIGGQRNETRPGEQVTSWVLKLLHPVLPRHWRINPAKQIANKLIEAAVEARPGNHIVTSGEMI